MVGPVLGPKHSDDPIIGFKPRHQHVDYRFLSREQRAKLDRMKNKSDCHVIYETPISLVSPDVAELPEHEFLEHAMPKGLKFMPLDALPHPEVPEESYSRLIPKKKIRDFPPYPAGGMWWAKELERAYSAARLGQDLVCPHQGASLYRVTPDPGGNVTCPLHGLRWNLDTGRLASAEGKQESQNPAAARKGDQWETS